MNASERRISVSLSYQFWVGNDLRNMMIDCKVARAAQEPAPDDGGVEWVTHLEVHFAELVGPADQEREADVEMEL